MIGFCCSFVFLFAAHILSENACIGFQVWHEHHNQDMKKRSISVSNEGAICDVSVMLTELDWLTYLDRLTKGPYEVVSFKIEKINTSYRFRRVFFSVKKVF